MAPLSGAELKAIRVARAEEMLRLLPEAEQVLVSLDRDCIDGLECETPSLGAVIAYLANCTAEEVGVAGEYYQQMLDVAKALCDCCGERAHKEGSKFCHICACRCGINARKSGSRHCEACTPSA